MSAKQRSYLREGFTQWSYYGSSKSLRQLTEEDGGIWVVEDSVDRLIQAYAIPYENRRFTTEQFLGGLWVLNSQVWLTQHNGRFPTLVLDLNRPKGFQHEDAPFVHALTIEELVTEWESLTFKDKRVRTLENLVILEERGRSWPEIPNELWEGNPRVLSRTKLNDGLAYACNDLQASKVYQQCATDGWIRAVKEEERTQLILTPSGYEVAHDSKRARSKPSPETSKREFTLRKLVTVFLSYAWEGDDHIAWVNALADQLYDDGVDVRFDRWDTAPGDDLPHFMEKQVQECDFVLIVCSPLYKTKAETRKGGAGYEASLVSGEIFKTSHERKFIPVLRLGEADDAIPFGLQRKKYVDLRTEALGGPEYKELVNWITRGSSITAPPDRSIS